MNRIKIDSYSFDVLNERVPILMGVTPRIHIDAMETACLPTMGMRSRFLPLQRWLIAFEEFL